MADKVEVVASFARRRRFSDEEKARIVAETLAPGATVAGVARQHGISQSLLFGWRKALRVDDQRARDLLPVADTVADIVRRIEAEVVACRKTVPKGRKRFRATQRLLELVMAALGSGVSANRIADATGLPRTTVKSWAKKVSVTPVPAPTQLVLVEGAPARRAVAASDGRVHVRIGADVSIDFPAEALTEAMLRVLLAAGGRS
jgi:transposase